MKVKVQKAKPVKIVNELLVQEHTVNVSEDGQPILGSTFTLMMNGGYEIEIVVDSGGVEARIVRDGNFSHAVQIQYF